VRLTYRNSLVVRVEFLEQGAPREPEWIERHFHAHGYFHNRRPECTFTYTYSPSGQVKQETALDHNGNEVWKLIYTTSTTAGYEKKQRAVRSAVAGGSARFCSAGPRKAGRRRPSSPTRRAGRLPITKASEAFTGNHDQLGFVREETYHDLAGKTGCFPACAATPAIGPSTTIAAGFNK